MPGLAAKKVEWAIDRATRNDAFNDNKPYINIRTLTTALRRARIQQQRAS